MPQVFLGPTKAHGELPRHLRGPGPAVRGLTYTLFLKFKQHCMLFNVIPISILQHQGQGQECIFWDLINCSQRTAPTRLISSAT